MARTAKRLIVCAIFVLAAIFASMAYSHCQIPCGIYGDQMRFDMIAEHITTINIDSDEVELCRTRKL